MALPTSRNELIDYTLRKLGYPVLTVDVTDEQLDDRLDECIDHFHQYHFEGSERYYLKHLVTASELEFETATASSFQASETIIGGSSGATAIVIDQATDNLSIRVKHIIGVFQDGEVITGSQTASTATLNSSDAVSLGDMDNHYISCSDSILTVVRLITVGGLGTFSMFDIRYQMALTSIQDMTSFDMLTYNMVQQHYSLIADMFVGTKPIRFNRMTNKIYLDMDWERDTLADTYLILECHNLLDVDSYEKVWSNVFVREYFEGLVLQQWGQNLSKFGKIQLAGGVELNGDQLYGKGEKLIEKTLKDLREVYEEPIMPFYE